jgi:acyl-CoA thioesterase FadM
VARFGVVGHAMRLRDLDGAAPHPSSIGDEADGEAREDAVMELTARGYECDTQQHVNNTVYADWLTEALERSLQRRVLADGARCPRYLRVEYVRPVLAGAQVAIATRLVSSGTRAIQATQTITDGLTGAVSVRATTRLLMTSRAAHEGDSRSDF